MKRIFCILLIVGLMFGSSISVRAVSVSGEAAILIDGRDGTVIYEKNADVQMAMASTTKIMTALLTLEEAAQNDPIVTATEESVAVEGSSMGLLPGYQLYLSDLAVGMLLPSGNDAATTAAYALAGNLNAFADKMNRRASELGMENTHFVTPSGLDSDEHYSTARDMALLAMHAMKNENFAAIVSQPQLSVNFVKPQITAYYSNHNKLLNLYENCVGIKTGYTKKSGRCLVSAAEKNGVLLIAVTLNAPDDWNDHILMYEHGFSQYKEKETDGVSLSVPIVGGEQKQITASAEGVTGFFLSNQEITYEITKEPFFYAPIKSGEVLGKVSWYLSDTCLAETSLTADCSVDYVEPQPKKNFFEKLLSIFKI